MKKRGRKTKTCFLLFMINCRLLGAKRTLSVAATLTFVIRSVDIPNFMFATTDPGEFGMARPSSPHTLLICRRVHMCVCIEHFNVFSRARWARWKLWTHLEPRMFDVYTFDHPFFFFLSFCSLSPFCLSFGGCRGNVIGATMYRTGRPGQTMCINEGLATSRRYPGLCGMYSSISL